MKTTRYFDEQVRRTRPYVDASQEAAGLADPLRRFTQPDGRVQLWGAVIDSRDGKTRILRVVTLQDGETVHNGFFDRDFKDTAR